MKKRRPRQNEHFQFGESTESGAAERALPNPGANGERKLLTNFGMRRYSAAFVLVTILINMFSVSAQGIPQVAPRAIPVAPTTAGPNDIARFLAGMPVPENSPLAPLTRDPAWQAHAAFFESEFNKLFQRQLQKLHAWTATNFPEVTQPTPVAFYMFSGPDFFCTSINFSQTPRCTCFAGKNQWGRRPIRCASKISPVRWEIWKTR